MQLGLYHWIFFSLLILGLQMQGSICGCLSSPSCPWADLGIRHSHSQCQLNSVCMAIHFFQFTPSIFTASLISRDCVIKKNINFMQGLFIFTFHVIRSDQVSHHLVNFFLYLSGFKQQHWYYTVLIQWFCMLISRIYFICTGME